MTEGPYKLPLGWRWMKLGEVCLRKVVPIRPSVTPGDRFNYLGLEHITPSQWEEPVENLVNGFEVKSTCTKFQPGYVLYAKLRPYLNKAVVCSRQGVASTEFVPLVPRKELLTPDFLGAFLRSPWFVNYTSNDTTGSRMPRVRMEALWTAPIPIPTLYEQRRILTKVDALMDRVREAKRLRTKAREDAEQLMQSALSEIFPRPGADLPKTWRWVKLGDIFELQQGASMSPKRRRGINPKPFLRTLNIRWGNVDLSHVDEMDFTEDEVKKLSLKAGDLLICEGGDVGRTALWQGEIETCLYQNHIHRLRRRDDSILPKSYAYWMQAAYQVFVAYAGQESRTAIPNLSGRRLKGFIAPLPPLDEQHRFVAYLDRVQQQVNAIERVQRDTEMELQRLEQAILDRAFRGEL